MTPTTPHAPTGAEGAGAFRTFGRRHLAILAGLVALCALVPLASARLSMDGRVVVGWAMSALLAGTVVTWTVVKATGEGLDLERDLPLDVCNLAALLSPIAAAHPQLWLHEIFYFLVMAGTLQANLTPDLRVDFPHRDFVKYWIVHGGLVVFVVHATVALELHPRPAGIASAFLAALAYMALVFPLNRALGANYAYLVEKPAQPTVLDLMGPWPWYVLGALGLGLALFVLCGLPVWILLG